MSPKDLLDASMDAIRRWNDGEQFADEPTLPLTLQRPKPPMGDSVRLYGRSGPKGRLATTRPNGDGWMVVAYFPAVAIVKDLARKMGVEIEIAIAERRQPSRSAPAKALTDDS